MPRIELEPALLESRRRLSAEGPGNAIAAVVRGRERVERLEFVGFGKRQSDQNAPAVAIDAIAFRQQLRRNRLGAICGFESVETAFQNLCHCNPQQRKWTVATNDIKVTPIHPNGCRIKSTDVEFVTKTTLEL